MTNFYDIIELTNIFRAFWRALILNINVLTYSDSTASSSLLLYTYFPFASTHCHKIVPVIWNSFESDQFVQINKPLFALKTANFFQCSISILAAPFPPYMFVTKNDSNESQYTFSGMEYEMLHQLSIKMNFYINFSIFWSPAIGKVYENGSADGMYELVSSSSIVPS